MLFSKSEINILNKYIPEKYLNNYINKFEIINNEKTFFENKIKENNKQKNILNDNKKIQFNLIDCNFKINKEKLIKNHFCLTKLKIKKNELKNNIKNKNKELNYLKIVLNIKNKENQKLKNQLNELNQIQLNLKEN